jgi:hypothetical protein
MNPLVDVGSLKINLQISLPSDLVNAIRSHGSGKSEFYVILGFSHNFL